MLYVITKHRSQLATHSSKSKSEFEMEACKRLVRKGVSIENLSYVSSFSVNCYFPSGWWCLKLCLKEEFTWALILSIQEVVWVFLWACLL